MKRLLLIRHGLTDWNEERRLIGRGDIGLNERGLKQARLLARELETYEIEGIYVSPQLRARQTAEPLAEARGIEAEVKPAFDEVWLSPEWKGRTVAELEGDRELERVMADPLYRSDYVEPIAAVQERTIAAVERLRTRHLGKIVVVVSHGDPLRAITAHYLGLQLSSFRRLACGNGSLTILDFNRHGATLERLNWRPASLA